MNYKYLETDMDGDVLKLYFNRPDKKNSMIEAMGDEVAEIVDEINGNSTIRCVIISGRGDTFSSGGDLDMIIEQSKAEPGESTAFMKAYYSKYFRLHEIDVPTIAMINGHAIGAGLCVSLACDLRTIADHAKVGVTFVNVGLNAGMGGTFTLPRIIGLGRALDLLLTGRLITAQEALTMGLVTSVHPFEELESKTLELARLLASRAPVALRYTKKSLYRGLSGTLEDVFESEAYGQSYCYRTRDILEGVAAVKEKRKPKFRGI